MEFIQEVNVLELDVLKVALEAYSKNNLDFVDCILCGYKYVKGYDIKTFDKKLNKLLNTIE